MMTKFPTKINELPDQEFYAILRPDSTCVPGDERSRTNPGHGYPEHTVDSWRMEVFPNREEWAKEVSRLSQPASGYGYRPFKAVKITPAKVNTVVEVKVED